MSRAEDILRDAGMLAGAGEQGDETMSVQPFNDDGAIQPAGPLATAVEAEIDALLMGPPPAVQFAELGASVTGRIAHLEMRQQTNFDTNEPKFWPDGRPMMQAVITLETGDGLVSLYTGPRGIRDALKEACRSAGIGLRRGGTLYVTYTSDGAKPAKGGNPPKIYEAAYDPPRGSGPTIAQRIEGDRAAIGHQVVQQAEPPF